MIIEFTHQRDRAYARRLASVSTRRGRLASSVIGVLVGANGLAATTADPAWATVCGLVGLGVGIGYLIKAVILPRQIANRVPAAWFQPRTYRFDADGVSWSSPIGRSWVSWAGFARVTVRPFAYLLGQPGGLAVWDVPRGSLTPEQDRQLAALFADRIRAAGTPVDSPVEHRQQPPLANPPAP